jgi:hypothetical protein
MTIPRPGLLRGLSLGLIFAAMSLCNIAGSTERLKLKNLAMTQSEPGRELLKYLVNCALGEGVSIFFDVEGQTFEYPGKLGLVPQWSRRALTLDEEQVISACILARTNFYGKTVKLSMRSDTMTALQTDDVERREFPLFEAGFFGNIFKNEPEYFVCFGESAPDRAKRLESHLRVCSLHSDVNPSRQSDKSRCGFTIVGACSDRPFLQNGQDYSRAVLQIFLPRSQEH